MSKYVLKSIVIGTNCFKTSTSFFRKVKVRIKIYSDWHPKAPEPVVIEAEWVKVRIKIHSD